MRAMIHTKFYGKTNYETSLELQQKEVEKIASDPSQVAILGFEFEPIITLGRSARIDEEVLGPLLEAPPVVRVERGGKATLHSPGQLVIYPLCNIKFFVRPVKAWVHFLLTITEKTLSAKFPHHSFSTRNESGAGIYSELGKVTSIGLRVDRGISSFGLALNLNNDPELFKCIRACGVKEQKIHSLNDPGSLEDFFVLWSNEFSREFDLGKIQENLEP